MKQAQFIMGVIGGFLSTVYQVVAVTAGDRRLGIIGFAAGAAGASQPVMCQHAGFRVAVAVTGDSDGAFASTRRFAKVSHNHPHIRLRQRESGRGGFVSSTSCALTVQVRKS